MSRIKIFTLILFVLSSSTSCAEENTKSLSPQTVLYGTDVKETSFFQISKNKNIQGQYVAEMGGALLKIEISSMDNGFLLKREFMEPGMPADKKSYQVNRLGNSFTGKDLVKLVIVEKGLLLYEKEPGSYGVPTDMWVYYRKK